MTEANPDVPPLVLTGSETGGKDVLARLKPLNLQLVVTKSDDDIFYTISGPDAARVHHALHGFMESRGVHIGRLQEDGFTFFKKDLWNASSYGLTGFDIYLDACAARDKNTDNPPPFHMHLTGTDNGDTYMIGGAAAVPLHSMLTALFHQKPEAVGAIADGQFDLPKATLEATPYLSNYIPRFFAHESDPPPPPSPPVATLPVEPPTRGVKDESPPLP